MEKKNIKVYYLNNTEVGLHYSPAKWIGKPEYKDIVFIRYAFGDSWNIEYVEPFIFENTTFIELTRAIEGTKFKVNVNSIIEFENKELIICTQENQNDSFKLGKTKHYLLTNPNTKVTIKNDHDFKNFEDVAFTTEVFE